MAELFDTRGAEAFEGIAISNALTAGYPDGFTQEQFDVVWEWARAAKEVTATVELMAVGLVKVTVPDGKTPHIALTEAGLTALGG